MNGAASETSKEIISVAGKASANAVFDSIANRRKRSADTYTAVPSKRKKNDIDSLIDGSGIVYD